MKGIVFNLLEDFITELVGEDRLDDIQHACRFRTQEPFVGPKTYPDEDFMEMVVKTCEQLHIPMQVAQQKFGEYCFPKLVGAHPVFATQGMKAKDFILSIDQVIHVEVKKLYPGALTPKFVYRNDAPGLLTVDYISPRALCHFMEGLLVGCANHFKENLAFHQSACTHQGARHCTFELKFT